MPDPRIFPIISSEISFAIVGVSGIVMPENRRRGDADFTNDST